VLGLQEVEKPEKLKKRGGVWFRVGSRQFHLGVQKDFVPAKKAHPAFLVEDVAALTRRLQSNGYAVVNDAPLERYDRIYADDPFGNRLEFLKPG
jgi:hypothetical protein